MSKLKRYNLLTSWLQHATEYQHTLSYSHAIPSNNLVIRECISAWLFLLEDLLQYLPVTRRDTRLLNWLSSIFTNDFQDIISVCKNAYESLIANCNEKTMTYEGFKGLLHSRVPGMLNIGGFLSPISPILSDYLSSSLLLENGCYKSEGVNDFETLTQFFSFPFKLGFTDMGLEEAALSDYLVAEATTASWSINIDNHALCNQIKAIISIWLRDFSYDGYRCQHGPGSVADSRNKCALEKYRHIKIDKKLSIVLRHDYDSKTKLHEQAPLGVSTKPLDRCSKLVFVPKNVTKVRSISMEPVTLQYIQQGVQLALRDFFDKHIYLSKIIKLGDQTQNKALAYDGSITNEYATIDLSHASDSVNWELVKYLFSAVPNVLKWLIVTRSNETLLPNGSKIPLSKFAPMGSSLCFPIETLIFAAIAQSSIWDSSAQLLEISHKATRDVNKSFSVYGDDIIVPTYAAQLCIARLKVLGFTPNLDKTYVTGAFKESCGGNFYCGHDITPIKYNPPWINTKKGIGPETYTALCSTANLAAERGYSMLRLFLIKRMLRSGFSPIFSERRDTSPKIYSLQPTNFHLKKFCKLLPALAGCLEKQRFFVKYTNIKTSVPDSYSHSNKSNRRRPVFSSEYKKCLRSDQSDLEKILYFECLKRAKDRTLCEYNLGCIHTSSQSSDCSIIGNNLLFDQDIKVSYKALLPSITVFNQCVEEV